MGMVMEDHQKYCNQDGAVYKGDIEDLCGVSDGAKKENLLEEDFSLVEVPSQGTDSLNFSLDISSDTITDTLAVSCFGAVKSL